MPDDLGFQLLNILQTEGRISNAEPSRRVSLSQPAVHHRMLRLERLGYIRQYVALLDREKIGYDLICFISVDIQLHQPDQVLNFRRVVAQMPEVLECFHITGEHDYLLKVVLRNRKDLELFVVDKLTPIPGIARIQTSLVLSEVKSTTSLALD